MNTVTGAEAEPALAAAGPLRRLHRALMPDYNRQAAVYWWSVVLLGALLNFMIGYLFWVENRALHIVLMSLLATFIALLVFLTAAMDNPFRGDFSVSPDAIQTVLTSVMKPSGG